MYVHNLPFSVTDDVLRAHFITAGPVVTALVLKRGGDGRSKGCGLVTYASAAAAAKAIEQLTESELEGRKILVREVSSTVCRRVVASQPRAARARLSQHLSQERRPPARQSSPRPHPHPTTSPVLQDRDAELPQPRVRAPRAEGAERSERPPRVERSDRPERPERAERAERSPRLEAGAPGSTLYVGNLPWTADWKAVKDIFRVAG